MEESTASQLEDLLADMGFGIEISEPQDGTEANILMQVMLFLARRIQTLETQRAWDLDSAA